MMKVPEASGQDGLNKVDTFVKGMFPSASLLNVPIAGCSKYEVDRKDVVLSRDFAKILNAKADLGVEAWSFTESTLEEVFLNVVMAAEDNSVPQPANNTAETVPKAMDEFVPISAVTGLAANNGLFTGQKLVGLALQISRFQALFAKRWYHSIHDQKALLSQIALPAFFVLVGMFVATAFPPPDDAPALLLTGVDALEQECVARLLVDRLLDALRVGHEQIVAHDLRASGTGWEPTT